VLENPHGAHRRPGVATICRAKSFYARTGHGQSQHHRGPPQEAPQDRTGCPTSPMWETICVWFGETVHSAIMTMCGGVRYPPQKSLHAGVSPVSSFLPTRSARPSHTDSPVPPASQLLTWTTGAPVQYHMPLKRRPEVGGLSHASALFIPASCTRSPSWAQSATAREWSGPTTPFLKRTPPPPRASESPTDSPGALRKPNQKPIPWPRGQVSPRTPIRADARDPTSPEDRRFYTLGQGHAQSTLSCEVQGTH